MDVAPPQAGLVESDPALDRPQTLSQVPLDCDHITPQLEEEEECAGEVLASFYSEGVELWRSHVTVSSQTMVPKIFFVKFWTAHLNTLGK